MTTILGIRAYDPNWKTDYILLAADSQVSFEHRKGRITCKDYGCRKILRNPKIGLSFAYAGEAIDPIIAKFNENTKTALKKLTQEKINQEDISELIKKIGLQYRNTYILGSNINSNLSLDTIYYPFIFGNNNTFFSKRAKIYKNLFRVFAGTGQYFALESIVPQLTIGEVNGEKKYVIPTYTLLFNAFQGLNNASEKDIYTGGHMDFAVITPNRCTCCWNFARLDFNKSKPFSALLKETENKFKKCMPHLTGETLDEILLGC